MKRNAIYAYAVLLLIVIPAHAFSLRFLDYLTPVYLVATPLALGKRVNINFSGRQIALAVIVSAVILLPFLFFFSVTRKFVPLETGAMAVQLFGVSFPEEIFFRGFLQDTLGNNYKAVIITSLLFAAAHLPAFFFSGDSSAPLTFFPSLVMGFLYLRTSNVIPATIFHFLANVVYLGSL
ncbi:MAG: CPBP family intramembrane metalloprotease [Nitrospiraceae bacterium]|nr:CPBP family intramembrane metalloprotease [Nitrospiraceae bacterium]